MAGERVWGWKGWTTPPYYMFRALFRLLSYPSAFFFCVRDLLELPLTNCISPTEKSHPTTYLHVIFTHSVNPVILGTLDVSERGYNPVLRWLDFILSYFRKTLSQHTHNPLGHCVTSRKVAGSIPDGFNGIFNWQIPCDRTMALESTQPLTEMNTRNFSWGGKGGRCVGLTLRRLSWNLGASNFWNLQGLSRTV